MAGPVLRHATVSPGERSGAGTRVVHSSAAVDALLAGLVVAQLLHLAAVAVRLPVDYWDGYEYLTNARAIAGHDLARLGTGYASRNPPLVPLLLAPVMLGYRPGGGGTALWGPHLLAVGLSALAVVALYGLLREGFARTEALLGCAVLAANPLFVHYAPFVLTDIPVMLLLTAAALAYLRARRGGGLGGHLLAGAALGAAVSAKYSAVFALPAFGVFEVLWALRARRLTRLATDLRPWLVIAAGVLLLYVVHAAVFARVLPATGVVAYLVQLFARQLETGAFVLSDPRTEFAGELAMAFTLPLVVVAGVGAVAAAWRRRDADIFCLSWLGVMFVLLSVVVAHKEARYAFPLVPPLVYLVVAGVGTLRTRLPPRLAALGLLLLAVGPVRLAAGEVLRFRDPVYRRPFLPSVARWLLARSAPGAQILATTDTGDVQFIYTMYPAAPRFFPWDEYYLFHHIGSYTLAYLLDRPTVREKPVDTGDLAALVDRFARPAVALGSPGDFYDTNGYALVPEPPRPLTATAVDRLTLRRVDEDTAGRATYVADGAPSERLVLTRGPEGWTLGERTLASDWRLFARPRPGDAPVAFPLERDVPPPAVVEAVRIERRQFAYR